MTLPLRALHALRPAHWRRLARLGASSTARSVAKTVCSVVNWEQVTMKMAERGVRLSNNLWVREVWN